MDIIPVRILNVNLEEQDNRLLQIEELIEAKRNMLIQKQKKLKKMEKQNIFLQDVKKDYNKYYQYIIQQKRDQMKALELLNQYVDDLTRSGTLNGHNLKDAKHEQKRIMSEMNNIRRGLDKIIADTNDIETNLKEKNII
jgi:hypothetical protein